jgi:hypothetical protein
MNFGFLQGRARSLLAGIAALVVSAGLASSAWAQPQMGLQYKFIQGLDDLTIPGGIHDLSGNGHDGTVINSSFAEFGPGPSGSMNAIHIDNDFGLFPDETDGSGINTHTLTNHPDLNFFNGPYTAMAWVNLDDQIGDHMVFGTPLPNVPGANDPASGSLYLGFRQKQVYNGWWGAGTGRDSAYDSQQMNRGYVGQPGEWHHVAWRFTGSANIGYQDIFQDGQLYQRFLTTTFYGGILLADGGVPNVPVNLLVGRNVGDGFFTGAFSGFLSDVRVYNVALDDATIATIASLPP